MRIILWIFGFITDSLGGIEWHDKILRILFVTSRKFPIGIFKLKYTAAKHSIDYIVIN